MKRKLPKTLNEKRFASEVSLFGKNFAKKAVKKIFHCDDERAEILSKELLERLII